MKATSLLRISKKLIFAIFLSLVLLCSSAWAGVSHQKVFVQQQTNGNGLTNTFTANASAVNDAVVVGVLCNNSGNSTPSGVTLTAPGWSFAQLGTINGATWWSAVFGAIAPTTASTTFTVTWTSASNCSFFGELGDEFSGNDTTGGTTTFDGVAQSAQSSGACTLNLSTGNPDDAVWGACWADNVTGAGSGYTVGGNDGAGDWSEYKITSDGAGSWETVNFGSSGTQFNEVAVSIKPLPLGQSSPSITSLMPSLGFTGSTIVISGSNFGSSQGSSTITFNGTGASVSSWSPNSITATVPTSATTGNVVVTVGGVASNPVKFTVINAITHVKAFVQQNKFGNGLTDTFTGAASAPNDVIVIAVYCVSGANAATNVTVTAPGWTGANAFQQLGKIGVNSVSSIAAFGAIAPNTNPANFTVSWTATENCNFFAEMGDEFAGADTTGGSTTFDCGGSCSGGSNNANSSNGSCSVKVTTGSANETVWGACAPSNAVTALGSGYSLGAIDGNGGEAEYKITTDSAGKSETIGFTSTSSYNAIGVSIKPRSSGTPPGITGLNPTSGQVGTSVTITGSGFGSTQGTSILLLGGLSVTPNTWASGSITFTVPSTATTGNVVVKVGGRASNAVLFTVNPNISSLSPSADVVGASVTISGSGFGPSQGSSTVTFNGTPATVTSWNSNATSITATVPAAATSGNVVVTVAGVASNGVNFTVLASPSIASLSPLSGFVGTPVTITGNNFGATQGAVAFNGVAATITSWSNTVITTTVPAGATTGNVLVTAALGGTPSNGEEFTVLGITHQQVFVQRSSSANGLTDTFTAQASAANDAVVIGALCSNGGSMPTDATITASGWTFTPLGTISGVNSWSALFGAIAPNTSPATFTVTWTASANCTFMGELGDEFSGADTTGGTTTFDSTAQIDLSNGACTLNISPGNANDAVWGACWPINVVTAVGPGFTQGANDGQGNWSEYKNTAASSGTWETVNFVAQDGPFNEAAVTIKPAIPSGTAPVISNLSPSIGAVGSTVVITGANFGSSQGSSTVTFNGIGATASSWNATSVTVTVPATASSGNVIVTVSGFPSNPVQFTVINGATHVKAFVQQSKNANGLTDTFIAAASAPNDAIVVALHCANGGTAASNVTLTAPGWTGANAFQRLGSIGSSTVSSIAVFGAIAPNTAPATFTVTWTDTVNCSFLREMGDEFVGADATGGNTTFDCTGACTGGSNNAHSTSGSCSLNVTTGSANEAVWAACAPSNSVTALGSGYTLGAIDGNGGETEYKVTTAAAGTAETGNFTSSTTYNSVAVTIKPFTAAVSPNIGGITPNSGNVGTSVTVSGANFGTAQGTSTVLLSGVAASPTSWGSASITFPVPSGATTGNVVVIVGGLASNAVPFTVTPTITGLTPGSGLIGSSVTISGTGFGASQGTSTVTFNGTVAAVTAWSANSITAPVPTGATTGSVEVEVDGILSNGMAFTVTPTSGTTSLAPANVSVGFADSTSASLNFPTPWEGSPNIVFLGLSTPPGAGAIRIDNPTSSPITIDSVTVDLQRPTAQFSLWGSFTIPANGSAILTQTQAGNFDTSAFPIIPCGGTLSPNETRIPRITITIAGTPQNFMDTAHVLDTGGFDLACRGNESLQWRPIATTGIANPMGQHALTPASTTAAGGSSVTATAQLNDASGVGLANVPVNFNVLSGPNAGQSGQAVTNSQGQAQFVYTGSNLGTDVLQASVKNASNGVFQSSQVTVTWQAESCSPSSNLPSGTPSLVYIGATAAEFNDSFEMAALLTDGTGTPVPGLSITFLLGAQSFTATTDSTGVARVSTVINSAPGTVPLTASFPGNSTLPSLQASQNININPDETRIRYTGDTLLGNSGPQTVSAMLLDPQSLSPIANKTVTFTVAGVTASAVTNSNGVATTTVTLGSQLNGPSTITVNFAGDEFFKPSVRTVPVVVYFPAGFVIWGGNPGGLKIGQNVNFWGSQWESQITGGQYGQVSPSFKGWSGLTTPVQSCQPNATPSTLTSSCWEVKPGQSFPPSGTLPNFIEVVVSTVIVKSGSNVFGNIVCGAVVQVNHTPPFGAVPGQPGFGTIAAVDGSCGNIFPAPAMVTATQTQPATVLPNQTITVTTTVNNSSSATSATNVTVSEIFDGLTPATATATPGNALANGSVTATFDVTVPAIPTRGAQETPTQYIQRLSALNGRIFTSTGSVTFSDPQQQDYLPVDVFSESVLNIPIIDLAVTGPAVVEPGAPATFMVTATNIGSAPASSVQIVVTKPDGTTVTLTTATIVPGSSFSQPVTFTQPVLAPIGANETTAAYLARLATADGQILQTSADVNWSDTLGNAYGDVGQQVFSSSLRVPILQVTPPPAANLLPSQNATLNFTINNTGGCTAVTSNLQVTNPDNGTATAPAFPLAAGQQTTATTTWHVTAVVARSTTETDSAYQSRLTALNNSTLNFSDNLGWTDPASVSYGPTPGTFSLTEVVPIVTVGLTAPANAQAGNTITYALTLTNIGGTASPGPTLTVTMPDGSMQTPAVGALAPNGTFSTNINYTIPTTQPAGNISASAVVKWNDSILNAYGPLTSTATTAVSNPTSFNSLVLTPAAAGPDITGTTQALTATLKDPSSNPIANATVQFTVTGTNATSGSGTTNSSGVATFSYSGALTGNDTVQATSGTAVSNKAIISWITPVQNVSTSPIFGRFFLSDGSGAFNIPPGTTPAFTQEFPTINFNPPAGTIPGNNSNVNINTRPFTDVTTDVNGNFSGTIIAQGNDLQAGVNSMFAFQAVFTGALTVASAGNVVINFFSDDGFTLGVGGGATRVSGPQTNVPATTPFENLPVMGGVNTPLAATGNTLVVNFPAAGTYPYEVDYTECCGGQLVLTMATGQSSTGVPPTGSLVLTPNNPPTLNTGQTQTFTVQASDESGNPVANTGVGLSITGANFQQLSATTDSTGKASFSYSAVNAGTDTLQASADISNLGSFSNIVSVNWSVPTGGGGGGGTIVFTPQGWIGAPVIGTTAQGQIPITVASGITLTSGTLEYWPTSNPSALQVLNSNTTGSGTIGTLDATTLASGGYTIQLQATANGTQQTSQVTFTVAGANKPGRLTFTATDFKVPLAGMPISIGRTYDSLNRSKSGDFGFGWSLATTVDLQVDASNNVSFTIGGQRRTFFFHTAPISLIEAWLLVPQYAPEPGLHGTLTSDGCGAILKIQGVLTCFGIGVYSPTTFTYTDPIGRKFVIAATGQIQSITDLNGNVLTFGPNGITSSLGGGVIVPFVRDSQGRITQISDLSSPANNYTYAYDGNGNLASITLPGVANPEQYTYDPTHLVLSETDPLGNSTQTQYDANGRIQSITSHIDANTPVTTSYQYTINADGTATTTTTFPDGGVQVRTDNAFGNAVTIVDPLQRKTSFTYDGQQNVLTSTDPLGNVTQYTYDANGFQTSVQDPLQHKSTKVYNLFGGVTSSTDALQSNTTAITDDLFFNPIQWSDGLGQFKTATYDSAGNMLSKTDGNRNTANFQYDPRGNLMEIDAPLSQTRKFTYDTMDRISTILDARQKQTTYKYDALGRISDRIDQDNGDTNYQYDGNNNLISVTDPLKNPPTTYQYDGLNHLTKITYPDQTTRQFTNDFRGNKLTDTDQFGHVTKYTYDLAGQLTSVTYAFGTPDAATMVYTYDKDGRKTSQTDGRGNTTGYGYDAAGRLTSVTDALSKSTSYGYDADNRRTSITDPNGHTTTYAYDIRGRLQTVTYNDKTTTSYTYDNNNNPRTITDQAGNIVTKNYDVLNRLSSVVDAMSPGQTTTYGYDADNNLMSVLDANQHLTQFGYDDLNRRNFKQLPLTSPIISESLVYDADGNLSTHTDFNGKTTTYTYDSMNRLMSKKPDPSMNEPTVSFTYTATGKRKTMSDTSGMTTYNYDNRDRLQSKVTPEGTLSYSYDGASNVLSITSSNSHGASLSYAYDADDRLTSAIDNTLQAQGVPGVTTYSYDPAGNLSGYLYPNTVQTGYAYDTLNRLTNMQSSCGTAATGCTAPDTPLASYAYTLGLAGNRTNVLDLGGRSVTYGYDNDYRLTSEAISGDATQNGTISYTYDPVGNRTQRSSSVPAIPATGTLTYDANDRGPSPDPYDFNGNLLNSGNGTNTWDFENRLIQDGTVSVIYDGDGNRVSETVAGVTTKYLIDDVNRTGLSQVLDELVNGSVTRTYAYGLQRISENQLISGTWTPSFYGYDGHDSVRYLTNPNASVTDTYEYDAFGNLLSSTGSTPNNYLFAGEQFDPALGMYQMRARWYRDTTGRFLSRDPIEGMLCCGLSWNPYLYVKDNPVNAIDPTGRGGLFDYLLRLFYTITAWALILTFAWEAIVEPVICIGEEIKSRAEAPLAPTITANGSPPLINPPDTFICQERPHLENEKQGEGNPLGPPVPAFP